MGLGIIGIISHDIYDLEKGTARMAFLFEIEFKAPHTYIKEYIESFAKEKGVDVSVLQSGGKITLVGSEADETLAPFLEALAVRLPASIFMKGSSHRIIDKPVPTVSERRKSLLPHAIGLCPQCMEEMFDPASRRYYYPFTACRCCGAHYPFFEHYPYTRENSAMRFFVPCEACRAEQQAHPFREGYPLISCHDCGISVRMSDRESERYANDPESFKRMFEVAARAIGNGKRVRIKTLFGDRLFFDPMQTEREGDKVMLLLDASRFEHRCAVIKEEIHAALSIERPLIHAAVSDPSLFDIFGKVTRVKYPDEGFTILLAKELLASGYDHIAYRPCGPACETDYVIDYDVEVDPQREMRLFINKSVRCIVDGERAVFPLRFERRSDRIVVAHGMAAVGGADGVLIDRMEKFDSAETSELYLLEGEEAPFSHSNTVRFPQAQASVMSVLLEHGLTGERSVGIYFSEEPTFIYHNGKQPIVAVPPMRFDPDGLEKEIAGLREGSDRLVENFRSGFPDIAGRLFGKKGVKDIFEAAAVIMDLPEEGFDAVGDEALKFSGKGGLQIDTRVEKNRFDPYAFLASLMSYRLAGVESSLLAYSIFESFGDYVTDIATQLKNRSKADHIVLCGKAFGNPSLFSRVRKNLGSQRILMNEVLPIDRENALFGALAL